MIYQCYYAPEQEQLLFSSPAYCGFGLEPEVNPLIAQNCPELEEPAVRLALTEYAAFLYLWRNPSHDQDGWIGFTSYRQSAKTPFMFSSKLAVWRALWRYDVVSWGWQSVRRLHDGSLCGAAAQAERAHPGIMEFIGVLADEFGFELPQRLFTDRYVLYANYWVMRKDLFNRYMEWSWPKVEWCLAHRNDYAYLRNPLPEYVESPSGLSSSGRGKNAGYVMERLFIIWYMSLNLKIKRLGPQLRL